VTCLTCGAEFDPTVTAKGLTICPGCKRAIVVADGRRAGMPETTTLAPDEHRALRAERLRLDGRR